MNLWSKILGLNRREQAIANLILLLLFVYPALLGGAYAFDSLFGSTAIILSIIVFTHRSYVKELQLGIKSFIEFEDDAIFYQFGEEINSLILPLKIPEEHELFLDKLDIVEDILPEMEQAIKNQIDFNLRSGKRHHTELVEALDKRTGEVRRFMKFCFEGNKGGMITHFVHLQIVGNYLAIHLRSHRKGIAHWYERYTFYLMSPFKILFWIIPWYREQFSILAAISKYVDDTFEEMDLRSYYQASQDVILDFLRNYLREQGLLTQEVENKILYQMTFNNYGNQIQIEGSNNQLSGSFFQKNQ